MGLFNRKSSGNNDAPPVPPPPPLPATDVSQDGSNRQQNGAFDANRFAYDVDIKTGLFYAVTFYLSSYSPGTYSSINGPTVTQVPYSKEVFGLIPEGKKEIYIAKFGDPEAAKETETQKTLRLLLEQVAELTGRLPPPSEPRQLKKADAVQAATGPQRIKIV